LKKYLAVLAMLVVVAVLAGASGGELSATSPIYANWANGYSANITITSLTDSAVNVSAVNVTNSSGYVASYTIAPASSNVSLPATVNVSFTATGLAPGQYNGTIMVLNSTNSSKNFTVNVTLDVPVNTVMNKTNKGLNTTAFLNFWLNNSANYNINLNVSNSSFLFNLDKNMTIAGISLAGNTSTSYNLAAGNSTLVTVNITTNTANTGNSAGNYAGWMAFASGNNMINVTLIMNLTSELVVTVSNVTNDTQPSYVTVPGSWINITVAPKYQNGTIATIPNDTNFSVAMTHVNSNACGTINLLNTTRVSNDSTGYLIKAYINSTAGGCGYNNAVTGGNYTVSVTATDSINTNSGTGTWAGNFTINDSALSVAVSGTEPSGTKSSGTTVSIIPQIYNYGSKDATGVTVNYTISGQCSFSSGGSNPLYIGLVPAWSSGTTNLTSGSWVFLMSGSGTCTITLYGYSTIGTWTTAQYKIISLGVSNDTGSSSSNSNNNNNNNVVAPTSSTTPATDMTIIAWPATTAIVQGASVSVDMKIKNSGATSIQSVTTRVDGIDASWAAGTMLTRITPGQNLTMPIKFTIPADAAVKVYDIVYVASSANATARASAKLTILPSENTKKTINTTLTNLTDKYGLLLKQLIGEASKGKNTSTANTTLVDAKKLIDQANNYTAAGDWVNANALLTQIQSALNNAETKMSALEGTSVIGNIDLGQNVYLLVGVGAVAIAIAAVVLWMTKTGKQLPFSMPSFGKAGAKPVAKAPQPSVQAKPPTKGGASLINSLKEKLKSKKSSRYTYHYQPE